MKQVAKPSSFKFEDLHEQVVQFPNSNRPFHRLITYLAADAIQEALSKKNWIVPENHAKFQSFVDISIDSLTRDDERVNINQSTNSRFGDVESSWIIQLLLFIVTTIPNLSSARWVLSWRAGISICLWMSKQMLVDTSSWTYGL